MSNYRYKALKINGKHIDEYRRIAKLAFGKERVNGMVVHHKNGDKKDNRIENLELKSANMCQRERPMADIDGCSFPNMNRFKRTQIDGTSPFRKVG